MRLTWIAVVAVVTTLGCLETLPSEEDFVRAELAQGGGPCTEEMDCQSRDVMLANGTYRYDRWGDPDGGLNEVMLDATTAADVRQFFTRSDVASWVMQHDGQVAQVTDSSSKLTLEYSSGTYGLDLAGNQDPIATEIRNHFANMRDAGQLP